MGDWFGFPGGINEYIYYPEPEAFHFNSLLAAATGLVSLLGIGTAWWLFYGAQRPPRPSAARAAAAYGGGAGEQVLLR